MPELAKCVDGEDPAYQSGSPNDEKEGIEDP